MIKTVTAQSGSYQYAFDISASANTGALIFDVAGIAEHSREITVDKLATRTVISGVAPKQRVVTLSIRIVATDVESERRTLRQVFAEGNEVSLLFEGEVVPLRTIQGTVESCNNPIFTKESMMTVTIICPDPVFYAEPVTLLFDEHTEELTNPGDVQSGCCITVELDGTITTGIAAIAHGLTDPPMFFDMAKVSQKVDGIQEGDVIVVDSGYKKQCVLIRGADTTNIFSAVSVPYTWPRVVPGLIDISVTGFGGSMSLEYRPGYGSI